MTGSTASGRLSRRARPLAGIALAAGALLSACGPEPAPPRVDAGGEMLEGEWLAGRPPVAAFRGVPFAAAPVGARRWRPEARLRQRLEEAG